MIDKTVFDRHIDIFVEKHGVAAIPDAIEKRIYGRLLKMMFDVLDKMSGRSMLTMFGHEIAFFIKPTHVSVEIPV